MSKRNGAGTGTINVAILGVGRIAVHMAETLTKMAGDDRYSTLINRYAVATRNDSERAQQFATDNGFEKGYGSYQELIDDPEVDLIYIATPHALHAEQAMACMRAGKNVLVEKSFTGNGKQAREVMAVADETKMLCTEAIWTRYMPSRQMILDIVASGEIGEVHGITANLAYPVSDKARMTDPKMAGGALLDLGVYPLNFIRMAHPASDIKRLVSSCNFTELGVDESLSTTLWFEDGVMGVMSSNMYAAGDSQGILWGEKGYMVVENINNPAAINIFDGDHKLQRRVEVPTQLTGYEYQVADAAHAVLNGDHECAAMPHDETIAMMDAMDAMRDQWGEVFPFEK
ncbi:MAG: Gfo/Idh/MocA family oxidoreductase [Bifidobacteriaceae bacterium]|nr:Gfo/Idh/MocA family oxidoreductase [Bifidobacteriaceae bacterium]